MIRDIFMPALSSTMTEGKIVSWTKAAGDKVAKGETVLIVESDKADMDVESFYEGYLATIIVEAGNAAPVGATIALIAETEAEIAVAKEKAASLTGGASTAPTTTKTVETPATTVTTAATTTATIDRNGRTIASPRAKKLAKELKVELSGLQGSGPNGRIVAEDVERAVGRTPAPQPTFSPAVTATTATVTTVTSAPIPAPVVAGETVAMNALQKAVVQSMMASLQVPEFRVSYQIVTNGLDALYKQIKSKGVTMTALLAKAVAVTLAKHPVVNARYVDNATYYNSGINIAIAVAMPDGGLITPVLKNADRIDIYSLSRAWKDLVDRSRLKQLQPDEYNSGTFTLSNLGMFGVDSFDAILPPGQGSILAVGAARPQLVAGENGTFAVKNQMTVNITCDHRVIYGAQAAAFLQDLAKLIETEPQSLTL
jgi:pyruvate dehydrogenase E2 component (dihydrolipoamide acetyltransferase)